MLAIGMLAAAAGLVLGLRFSLITLLLLTLAIVITFATSVLGGSGSLAVGLQMLATLASVQISYLFGCLLAAHLPVRAELPSEHCKCGVYRHAQLRGDPPLIRGDEMTFRMGRSGRLRRCKKATATSYLTSKPIQAALIVIVGERWA